MIGRNWWGEARDNSTGSSTREARKYLMPGTANGQDSVDVPVKYKNKIKKKTEEKRRRCRQEEVVRRERGEGEDDSECVGGRRQQKKQNKTEKEEK